MRLLVCLLAVFPVAAAAQDLPFEPDRIEACLEAGEAEQCIGRAAEHCASTPDGSTTVGLGFCYGQERDWWDARLNRVYGDLMDQEKAIDDEMAEIGSRAPKRAPALLSMQRAWIVFRDAACSYEYTQWGGGTGGGPANAACLMKLTGQQTLLLESNLQQ